ncbi:MAG: TIM barrel protein [Bacteroidota bacterium]
MLASSSLHAHNASLAEAHDARLDALASDLSRRGRDAEALIAHIGAFDVAIPSWALGTGGTRFGRFPGAGEPRDVYEKMEDVAVIHQLTRAASKVSLHIPWDEPDDPASLQRHAADLGLGFDAVNSNTFQDQAGQAHSYKFGSLAHTDEAVRAQAVEHIQHVIRVGETLGSDSITVWLSDGTNYPGQASLRGQFERVLDGLKQVYATLPDAWRLFTEHKPYEPAFYSTVVQDWGTSYALASALGDRASCLVDLGHHLPNTNIELVVARLLSLGKLGGFHFNDSKYGDDDLTTGSIQPYRLFLVFNELVDAADAGLDGFDPAYMIDQSHNVKDPIEALLQSVDALQHAYAQALLVDRPALDAFQRANDVLMAERTLQSAFRTDVGPLVAEARRRAGGALDPLASFRSAGYRPALAERRAGSGAYVPPQSL